jgi:hypothetical protein
MIPSVQLLIPGVVVAVLLVLVILFFIFRATYKTIDIRKHGTTVAATVTKIDAEWLPLSRRGSTTFYYVYADWEDPRTHKVYHFKSEPSSVRVSFRHPPGSQINVLIDPKNPRRYEVVLEFDEQSIV